MFSDGEYSTQPQKWHCNLPGLIAIVPVVGAADAKDFESATRDVASVRIEKTLGDCGISAPDNELLLSKADVNRR